MGFRNDDDRAPLGVSASAVLLGLAVGLAAAAVPRMDHVPPVATEAVGSTIDDRSVPPHVTTAGPAPSPALQAAVLDRAPPPEDAAWGGVVPEIAQPQAPQGGPVDVELASGDTLLGRLVSLGVTKDEAHAAVQGLREVFDPRRLRVGQKLTVETSPTDAQLVRLAFDPDRRASIELARLKDGGFTAKRIERETVRDDTVVEATVRLTLDGSARRAGVPSAVLARVIDLFGDHVDFRRSVRPGDRLAVLFESERLPDGTVVGTGDLHYARLVLGDRTLEAFRRERDGNVEYFDRDGRSWRKLLLATPLQQARITSRFGMRRHPILGYSRMHQGVDYAAPTGTPVYASASGRVARAGRRGGYGNYVRIDHGNGYETAYAHLHRIGRGVKSGKQVKQGALIGYVGSTGRSTGPHLHFEVIHKGRHMDPLKIAETPALQLAGGALERHRRLIADVEARIDATKIRTVVDGAPTLRPPRDG
ncbi:MAG: M23 family metallopeptidase [Pseudomonadota bacterium]